MSYASCSYRQSPAIEYYRGSNRYGRVQQALPCAARAGIPPATNESNSRAASFDAKAIAESRRALTRTMLRQIRATSRKASSEVAPLIEFIFLIISQTIEKSCASLRASYRDGSSKRMAVAVPTEHLHNHAVCGKLLESHARIARFLMRLLAIPDKLV